MDAMTHLTSSIDTSQVLSQSRMMNAKQSISAANKAKIDKAAEDFESVFLSQVLEELFSDIDIDPGNDGPGEDIYKSLLLDQYGKIIAKAGGIGIADHVRREIMQLQEI